MRSIEKCIEKKIPNQQLAFSVHLCEHCNLNCAGCNNFSPLASEAYTDIEQFENDMKRLSELADGEAYKIQFTGGEPLLNQRAIEYAVIARSYFPYGRISFVTNGTLLRKQTNDFFDKCVKYGIDIDVTPYPIGIDYGNLGKWLEEKGIFWKYHDGSEMKKMRKEVFDLNPNVPNYNATHNWLHCYMANNCVQLNQGKLMCTKIANAHHFIDYFGTETKRMYISKRDYIDIYDVRNVDEIFNFFAKPFPFCRFCNVDAMAQGVEWSVSQKRIEEWT